MNTVPLTIASAVGIGALMHWWPRLSGSWRRRASLLTSVAGIAFLVAALRAEGRRETALVSFVLVGPATATETTSADASLYYYVLTAFCFLLGFAGLVSGDLLAGWLRGRPLLNVVAVAWLVTAVRFLLEKSAAPEFLVDAMGVSWMAPFAGAYLASGPPASRPAPGSLPRLLAAYAYLVRGAVAALGVLATRAALGTHYDVSGLTSVDVGLTGRTVSFVPGGVSQVFWLTLVPQLLVWPAYTVAVGLAAAALARRIWPTKAADVVSVPASGES